MAQISSSVGLVSGINTGAIIDQLLALDQQPVTLLQTRIQSNDAQQTAYNDLQTQLQSIQTAAQALQLPSTFLSSTANSSNQNVLTATTSAGAPAGTYQFQVAQLVTAQQSISNGYASSSSTIAPGTISFELGGGGLSSQTALSSLNGGAGVAPGQFRITDKSGKTDVINTGNAVNLDDVVNDINNSLDISVHASIQNDHLVLTDTSGGSGSLSVADLGSGSTAKSLGIAGTTNAATLTGSSVNYLSTSTELSTLNDGRGIQTSSGTGDFVITTGDGAQTTVSLSGAQTLGDVVNAINTAGNGKVTASLGTNAKGITLTDTSGGSGSFTVADINGSQAAQGLGIQQTGTNGTINGSPLIASLDSVLVSSLNGGSGLQLGTIAVTDRAGGTPTNINLSGATSVQDILDTINNAGAGITASLNSAGNGIQIQDISGGSGNLVIADTNGGTTAQSLGISGTFNTSQTTVDGGDLHLQYVTQNTTLASYNGGSGVSTGSFQITNSLGGSATVDLSQGTFNTIGDVIKAINAKQIGVTASINANGNGILLSDTSGGAGKLTVTNVTGTTATDLNIAGTATGTTLDGAQEKSITVASGDTLATVQQKIQNLGFGVAASIINDGSAADGYHLSLTATNSGKAGQVLIGGGTTGLQFRNLVNAQDAAVFVGGTGAAQPLLVTGSSNQITNVIPGVTLSLQSASSTPVTLSITRDGTNVQTQLQNFTTAFNTLVDKITTYTQFNTTTDQGAILLGDATTQEIQSEIYNVFSAAVSSAGPYRTLGDVGLTIGSDGSVTFDSSKFQAAFAANPTAVQNLFTTATTGLGAVLNQSMNTLIDPVSGAITLENNTLNTKNQDFQNQITQLNALIANKRTMLQNQFNNMETVLAGLQSQSAALASLGTIKATTSSSSSTGSSDSSSSSSSSSPTSSSSSTTG
jgi:flagellar hook-associated protein 2